MKELYDPSKIVIPKTNTEFWLALLRVRNQYLTEAAKGHARQFEITGEWDDDHVWHTWLRLDFWLDQAFEAWRMAK